MALFLEIIAGEEKTKKFRLQEGSRVGRLMGEIIIKDHLLSSMHAQIEKNHKGELLLVEGDAESGLEINGRKVKRVLLRSGVNFSIGNTRFKVVEAKSSEDEYAERAREKKKELKEKEQQEPSDENWKVIMMSLLTKNTDIKDRHSSTIRAFRPIFSLIITRGIQADTEWTLGWGPRSIGKDSLEFRLQEGGAPSEAFKITPDAQGRPEFKTEYSSLVLVNGLEQKSCLLKFGDKINIGDTEIEVSDPLGA